MKEKANYPKKKKNKKKNNKIELFLAFKAEGKKNLWSLKKVTENSMKDYGHIHFKSGTEMRICDHTWFFSSMTFLHASKTIPARSSS